jgi:hypothetical protein
MRRGLVIALVVLLVPCLTPRSSQALTPSIGFQGSLNIAKVSVENLGAGYENKSRVAPAFGGRIAFPLNSFFTLESGLNISMQGTKLEYTGPVRDGNGNLLDNNGSVTQTGKVTYLTVPANAKFTLVTAGAFRPYLKAGPMVGIKMSAKNKTEYTVANQSGTSEETAKEIKGFDFGLGFGGGSDFKIAPKIDLFGELGYTLGLLDVTDNTKAGTKDSNKNRNFAMTVGMMFHL